MGKVNWGIIGLGNIANKFAESFIYSNNGQLMGIASNNFDKLKDFKKKYNIDEKYCFNNYDELLNSNKIDIIYIALPNSLHYKWMLRCIDRGKKFLVEKPAVINLKEIQNIKNYKKSKNFFFSEGFMYRFQPQIFKTIDLIKNNQIGKVLSIESNFGVDILTSINLFGLKLKKKMNINNRLFNKDLGGGAILDLGSYAVSFCTLIAALQKKFSNFKIINKPKEMSKTNVDIDSYLDLIFDNGIKTKIGASFLKNLGRASKIIGDKGEILIHDTWLTEKTFITLKKEKSVKIEIDNSKNIYSNEIDFISKCILQNKKELDFPGVNLEDTITNTKILEEWLK